MENFGQQTSIWHALLFGQWHFYAGWHYTVDNCCHSWFDLILVVCSAVPADRKASVPSAQVKSLDTHTNMVSAKERNYPGTSMGCFKCTALHLKELFWKTPPIGVVWLPGQSSGLYRWLLSWNLWSHSNVEMGLSLFVRFNSDLFV